MISRANQMDAGRLDVELTNMLLEQFLKAFSLIEPVRPLLRNIQMPDIEVWHDDYLVAPGYGRPGAGASSLS